MRIKKGDNVKMLSGKDRGKTGKVIRVSPDDRLLVVDGLNVHKRHMRPRKQGEKGQVATIPGLISIAKVALICPKCSVATRVGYEVRGDKKVRMCKKCQSEI